MDEDDSINGNAFSLRMSGSFQEVYTDSLNSNAVFPGYRAKKRRLEDPAEMMAAESVLIRGRTFLPVRAGSDVYSTENWKASGTSLFAPVSEDLYINVNKYEQVTVAQGSFHSADSTGNFKGSLMGHVVHLWRYDKQQRKNFISLSVLYTNSQDFFNVVAFLQNI